MSYIVLARKWRPRQFDQVVGQEHVARTLKNAIEQDRVAHAFLFAGPRGVGKTSTARILAKALNCKNSDEPTATPCDECISCTEIKEGQAVDVFEIDGASNRGINEIRELRESVRYAPGRDRYRVYIIDEVHMLTTEAFNALLKTLEEPPPHAKFIFATTEPQKIPVTILSRCQRYDFKRIGQNQIVEHLTNLCDEENIAAEKGALQIIARQAAGGMRDALSLLDQIISFAGDQVTETQVLEILGVANRKQLFALSEAVLAHDAGRALKVLDEVNRYGYDLQHFAGELVAHFRDLMVVSVVDDPEGVTDLTESEIEAANEQVDGVAQNLLHRYFAVMAEGAQEMSQSSYPKLIFEMTLVRLAQLEPLVGIDLLVDRLSALEGGEPTEPPAGGPANPNRGVGATGAHSRAPKHESAAADVASRSLEQVASEPAPQKPPSKAASPPPPSIASSDEPEPEAEPAKQPPPPNGATAPARPAPPTDAATPAERWRAVVDLLRDQYRPLAMTCEHAYVEQFDDGVVELAFASRYLDFVGEEERIAQIRDAANALFGDGWDVRVGRKEAEAPADGPGNLAEEREEEIRAREQSIEDELRNNPVIRQAQQLFEVSEDDVRVQVQLFDKD